MLKFTNKKGFTLIEIIIVLAILAILIAFIVPNLIGYLGQANSTSDNATARLVYTSYLAAKAENAVSTDAPTAGQVANLAGLNTADIVIDGTFAEDGKAYITTSSDGSITNVKVNKAIYPETTAQ